MLFQHNASIRYFSTMFQHNTSIRYFRTIFPYARFSTMLPYDISAQCFSTMLQHNTSIRYFRTIFPYTRFSTMLPYDISAQCFRTHVSARYFRANISVRTFPHDASARLKFRAWASRIQWNIFWPEYSAARWCRTLIFWGKKRRCTRILMPIWPALLLQDSSRYSGTCWCTDWGIWRSCFWIDHTTRDLCICRSCWIFWQKHSASTAWFLTDSRPQAVWSSDEYDSPWCRSSRPWSGTFPVRLSRPWASFPSRKLGRK